MAMSEEARTMFEEGVRLILSRWTALQLALDNEWGGPSSKERARNLHASILTWITRPTVDLYIDELEDMLDEIMIQSFNAEIEDGSLEEVAEHIMIIHEECMEGNYESVKLLSSPVLSQGSVRSQQVDEEGVAMSNEGPVSLSGSRVDHMDVDSTTQSASASTTDEAFDNPNGKKLDDGWQLVASRSRKNRHKS